jgi:hypothetical protein
MYPEETDMSGDGDTQKLKAVSERIKELGDKSSQMLLFLSFAIVVVILRQGGESSQQSLSIPQSRGLYVALWSWVLAIFPVALCILPVKEHRWNDPVWYEKVHKFKVRMLRLAIFLVIVGTLAFACSITGCKTASRPMPPSETKSEPATVPIPKGAILRRISYDVFDCAVSQQQRQFCATHDVPGLDRQFFGAFVLKDALPEPSDKVNKNPSADECINADAIVNFCKNRNLLGERLKSANKEANVREK